MVRNLLQALIGIVIGLALLPVVATFASDLTGVGGQLADTSVGALVDLMPILYVIILIAGAVGYVAYKGK